MRWNGRYMIGLWWVQIAGASPPWPGYKRWHLQSTEGKGLTFCSHLNELPLQIEQVSLSPMGDACGVCTSVYLRDLYYRIESGYDLTPCEIGAHLVTRKGTQP